MYSIYPIHIEEQSLIDTFFMNTLYKDHKLYKGEKGTTFRVDKDYHFRVCTADSKYKNNPKVYYAVNRISIGQGNQIPLWLFGFLY